MHAGARPTSSSKTTVLKLRKRWWRQGGGVGGDLHINGKTHLVGAIPGFQNP